VKGWRFVGGDGDHVQKTGFRSLFEALQPFVFVSAEEKWKNNFARGLRLPDSRIAGSATGMDERISSRNQPVFIQDLSKICVSIDQKH
jgi:hypothetical protein